MLVDNTERIPPSLWVGLVVIAVLVRILSLRYQPGLSKFNGPFVASFTNFWRLWQAYWYDDRVPYPPLRKYGKIVRLGPNTLLFTEPQAIRDIYTAGFQKVREEVSYIDQPFRQCLSATRIDYLKSNQYRVAAGVSKGVVVPNIFSTTDKDFHAKLRRSVSAAFSLTGLIQYEPLVDRSVKVYLEEVDKRFAGKIGEEGIADLAEWNSYFALDVISELTYGTSQGFLRAGHDVSDLIVAKHGILRYFHVTYNVSWLDSFLYKNPVLLWLGRRGWYNRVTPTVPFAQKQLDARLAMTNGKVLGPDEKSKEKAGQVDLLSKFLQAKEENPELVNDRVVLGLSLSMVNAGSGTTSTTLSAMFYYLLKDPVRLNKLVNEIDAHFPPVKGVRSQFSFDDYMTPYSEASKLQYLDACLKETFRIHPALGGQLLERLVPPGGANVCGEWIPGGTIVSCNAWTIHRHKPTFGEDVESFRPERWIDGSNEQVSAMNKALLAFGAGPNTCIGNNIAKLEIYKAVPTLLRAFEVSRDLFIGFY